VVDINSLVEEAPNLAYHGARALDRSFNITLVRVFGANVAPIEFNPQDITRVCLNLIGTGFYAARISSIAANSAASSTSPRCRSRSRRRARRCSQSEMAGRDRSRVGTSK
jgi:hypothetical protein